MTTTANTNSDFDAALHELLARHGRTLDEVTTANGASTVGDHISEFLTTLTANTRRTYATHLYRLRDGIGPVCDQTCESCLDPTTEYLCRRGCSRCLASRLTVSPATFRLDIATNLAVTARHVALKAGAVAKRRRSGADLP